MHWYRLAREVLNVKTVQFLVIYSKGRVTGFATMIEALQFGSAMANHMKEKVNIVQETREHCKTIEPTTE